MFGRRKCSKNNGFVPFWKCSLRSRSMILVLYGAPAAFLMYGGTLILFIFTLHYITLGSTHRRKPTLISREIISKNSNLCDHSSLSSPLLYCSIPIFPYPTSSLPKNCPCSPGSRRIAFWLQRAKVLG